MSPYMSIKGLLEKSFKLDKVK